MRRNVALLLVLVAVAVPYVPTLRRAFVYDDHGAIQENTFLEAGSNIWRVLTLSTFNDPKVLDGQRPVLLLTHFVERAAWGLNPFGYHLTNLLLHLAAVALVYFLSARLTDSPFHRFAVSLLFGLHPILSEAVLVPSFREDLLVTIFGLLYLLFASRPFASLAFLALGLFSKESAIVFPALAAWLWLCFPVQRPPAKKMFLFLGLGVIAVGLFLLALGSGRGLQAMPGIWNGYSLQFPQNLLSAPCLFLEYLRLLVVPWPLCADRIFDPPSSILELRFVLGIAGVLATLALTLQLRRLRPATAFGLGWMLLAFLPVSNIVPLFNPMADRYLYFMAVGFAFVIFPLLRYRLGLLLPVVYVLLLALRVPDWKDDYTLWMKTGNQEFRSARAHVWIGLEMKERGHREVAARHFRDADKINPQDVTALINIAILDGERGDLAGAEAKLREAIRRRPDKRAAYDNLAVALELQHKSSEAEAVRNKAGNLTL